MLSQLRHVPRGVGQPALDATWSAVLAKARQYRSSVGVAAAVVSGSLLLLLLLSMKYPAMHDAMAPCVVGLNRSVLRRTAWPIASSILQVARQH